MIWGRKRFLDAEVEEWRFECWLWLLFHLGGVDALRKRRLVLPTAEFFPKIEEAGHGRAEAVLARVKLHMGMEDWPCLLIPRQATNAEVAEFVVRQSASKVAATFGFVHNEAAIT